jgi:hypothetical protein
MQEKTTRLLARGWARWAMAGVSDVAEVTMKLESLEFLRPDAEAAEAAWEQLEPGEKLARCMQAEVAAQAAEVRAVAVAAADAEFLACTKDLQLVTARRDMQYGKSVDCGELSVLEERVRRARADAAVARAVEAQARASLQALQARRA